MDVQLYHVGVLVHDLEVAQATFSQLLGVSFGPVIEVPTGPSNVGVATTDARDDLRVVLSREGPMYLELIEAQDFGLWGRQLGEGVHHIGGATSDLSSHILLATERGGLDGLIRRDGHDVAAYLGRNLAHGVCIEFVDRSQSVLNQHRK
jgi:hypothetical protein